MATLLQILKAHKRYGDQVLLDGADLTLADNVKVGFIGRNGAGKSTLLRILLGEEELDSGEVSRSRNLRVGYLRQHDPFMPGESALDFLMRDSRQPDWKCGEIAGQFELKGGYLEGPVSELSGGWQTRLKLAALLLHEPNLLMLDEPTNFLDLRTQILLEHFLRGFSKACLIVSHDRTFLEATCEQTLDLARGKLTLFSGRVSAYLQNRAERQEHDRRVNAATIAKQRQLKKFIDKNRANANTASQARSKAKQLARLELNELEMEERTAHIRAPLVEPRKGTVLRCQALVIGYPDHEVASDILLEVEHGQRAAIVGDNGEGKTTLLRTLVGSLPERGGRVKWGYGCEIGTYAQHVYTSLAEHQSVLDYLEYQAKPGTNTQEILAVAGALLFRDDHVRKRVKVLSGGERARLCLAGLLLGDYNVLVLDEPGNHLDVETVEALAEALLAYRGTVLFTSHDRHFMSRVATSVIEVRSHRVRHYSGDYGAYVYAVNKEIDEGERDRNRRASARATESSHSPKLAQPDAANQRDHRKRRRQLQKLERKIAELDDQKRKLNDRMLSTTDPGEALQLHDELATITAELSQMEDQWCEMQEELA